MRFFYNLRRRRRESMTEWIAQHAEALWEASQAMRKLQREFRGKGRGYQSRAAPDISPKTSASQGDTGSNGDPTDEANETEPEGPLGQDGQHHGPIVRGPKLPEVQRVCWPHFLGCE